MNNKIYVMEIKRTQDREDDEYHRDDYQHKRTIFTKPDKLAQEMDEQVLHMVLNIGWDNNWNRQGDEWRVNPDYAEGCKYYEDLRDPVVKQLARAYSFDCITLPDLDIDNWDDGSQEKAHSLLPMMQVYVEKILAHIKGNLPTSGFEIKCSPRWDINYTFKLRVVDLDKEFFNAPKVIINETTYDKSYREQCEYDESEEGKAEREAEAERQQEIRTFMGENGYHNMISDGDTIRMW